MMSLKSKTQLPSKLVREHSRHIAAKSARAASRMSMVLLGNDSWELFDGIPKHYTLRTRVKMKLRFSTFGFVWEICQTLLAIVASLLYVVQTYKPEFTNDTFDLTALVVFSFDYLLNLFCAENRFLHMFSFMSIMDAVTILPSVLDRLAHAGKDSPSSANVGSSFPFLRFIRVLRLLRLTRLIRAASARSISAVQKQIHTIVVLITCIVFISAGVFHAVESANRHPGDPDLTFGDALYFLLVTMSTVGFGDIAPMTSAGKAVAMAVIVIAFTIIPAELTRLTQLMGLQSQFRRFYNPIAGNPHILVVGHVSDARTLLDFFKEMYHPDRQLVQRNDMDAATDPFSDPPCVIMSPHEPSEAIVNLLDHPMLQNRVTFIKGSVMSEEDLCRVGADTARACFVLVPKASEHPQRTDGETVLRLLAIRNYNTDLEVYTQMVSPAYSDYISELDADHVLCIDEIKLSLMAKSCLCPGLVTLVSNMFRSSSSSTTPPAAPHVSATKSSSTSDTTTTQPNDSNWLKEYVEGVAMEVYATKLPVAFYGLSFAQACDVLYQCFNGEVIMMGVYEPSPHDSPFMKRTATYTAAASSHTATAAATQLPNLKVHAQRPVMLSSMSPSSSRSMSRQDEVAPSRMWINPGHTLRMGSGQIVYMLCESKRLIHTLSISEHLNNWLTAGHTLPLPLLHTKNTAPIGHEQIATPLQAPLPLPPAPPPLRPRHQGDALLDDAIHPHTGHAIENHIIVVSDLDCVAMQTFVRLLRLRHHVPGSSDYHAILFLSWSTKKTHVASVCRMLHEYDDVYLMMAQQDDSKIEFLRANILHAARCVLLSDKASITQLDGEAIDAPTVFHYLAILSLQSEYGIDTTSGLLPIVELTMPRTMKILDTALKKRTIKSFYHRQQIHAFLIKTAKANNAKQQQNQDQDDPDSIKRRCKPTKMFSYHKRITAGPWATKLVQQLVQQGADNITTLENSYKLRKRLHLRHSTIKHEQDASTSRSASFDATGTTALLPFFAAGYGFSDDVFDNMLCQSFFTPGLLRFIDALLFSECRHHQHHRPTSSGRSVSSDDEEEEAEEDDEEEEEEGNRSATIMQVQVPPSFVGKTFGQLFSHLIVDEQAVAIALYRGSGVPFSLPYVATGPANDTVLVKDDLVFVLAQPA